MMFNEPPCYVNRMAGGVRALRYEIFFVSFATRLAIIAKNKLQKPNNLKKCKNILFQPQN